MKSKILIIASVTLILCLGIPFLASAEKQTIGLSKGDILYYDMYAEYHSSNSSTIIQIPAFEANNTSWVRIEITDVSGSVISHNYVIHSRDGNEQHFASQTNLSDPSGYSKGFRGVPLCQANLEMGDSLLGGRFFVNNVETRIFPTGTRQLVFTSWNTEIDSGRCCFDKQTGVLVELSHIHLYIDPGTNEFINKTDYVKLVSSSLW